ncbi:PAS domain-containing sensor histidine kinase [Aphanothece hegewaldii CCALA 016]|uniref:histidine kinase n=1 Tax=Aphanothece hegewaldii CCALA 016 TaxID=2107694 RepID=A0A2T1M3R4_9CHRO|nr:PAS domain S-box protein [Aphanothece hegewaldii]PSF39479.1 PAS domain-containing sensor histidine kinase [Aphanothece hegewaldii CCALA 016]
MSVFGLSVFFLGQYIPHGHCYLWQTGLVSLHVTSDAMTALAYYSIPAMLIYFVRQRQDVPFSKLFWLFSLFIAACGTSHVMEVWTLWYPVYWLSGAIKAITALVSVYTALELYPLIPQALALPSPEQVNKINQEIQEALKAQIESETDKERLALSLAAAKTAAWDWNLKTNKVYWTPEHEIIFGYEPGIPHRTYEDWANRVHPKDIHRLEAIIKNAILKHHEVFRCQYRIVLPDMSLRWIDAVGRFLFDAKGNTVRMVGTLNDITEKKLADEALKEGEERFRATFEQAAVGIAHVGLTGQWLRVNQKICDIVGYTREELLGMTFQDVTYPEDLETDLNYANQLLAGRISNYSMEKRYIRKDGSLIWVNLTVSFIYDTNFKAQPKCFISVIEDINQRKQAEEELKSLNNILLQTTDLLRKRNQELDQFAYIVSHDLKAPLRAIANLSEWIEDDLDGQLPEENQQQMKLLRQRVYRMEDMINGMLIYSRAGRVEVALEPIYIKDLIEEVIDSLAPPKTFKIKVPSINPQLITKPLLLSQVLANLISNAIKHHESPNGLIEISIQELENAFLFAVSDDGPGIAPENHDKVFGIFQTLKPRDNTENTGIGLSIVKKIIESEGGSISLESDIGQGATFRFTWLKHVINSPSIKEKKI